MSTKTTNIILFILITLAFIAGMILYPQFPVQIASHWNAAGEVNGYMGKFWGIFLMPFFMVGLFILLLVLPKIDPLKNNINSFRKYYNSLWIFIFAFFLYIFAITLAWNLGYRFNFTFLMIPAMAVLWLFLGFFLRKVKRNWFIGIRTPWTLSNDVVWEKTHRLGGWLFMISGVITLLGLFFHGVIVFVLMIIPVLITTTVTIIYSYVEYRKLK
jgi:uncharacterized membrane protein